MKDNPDRGAKLMSLAVHEFRTPVSVVAGYLRILLRHHGASMTEQQRTLVELGDKSCGALGGLLAELSELAQLEAGQTTIRREPLRLLSVLTDLATNVREGTNRGVTFAIRPDSPDVWIVGDPTRLPAAFATLVAAALRERADAVPVEAACRLVECDGRPFVRIAIANASDIEAILASGDDAPFDEYRGGLGFRLLLASAIVSAHGGRIVSPEVARGRLSLRVSLPAEPTAERPGRPGSPAPHAR
jgi:signal transduction histidine kinase